MIVMKFGGTSVESAAAIERVAAIVQARLDRRPIVVVSAMGRTTDKLLAIGGEAVRGRRNQALARVAELREFHLREARPLVLPSDQSELDCVIEEHFRELVELVQGLAVLGELTPRSIDAISSYGERLSSRIVALAFRQYGVESAHVDSRCLIVTDRRHTQAAPLLCQTYARLSAVLPELARDKVVVMGGFIGASEDGVTTTLGRGGSDFTAALVGAGVDAEEIQIWTDVDGVLTCDPALFAGAHRVKTISFAEAAELACFGAKVLHRHRASGDGKEYPCGRLELAPPRRPRNADRVPNGALCQRDQVRGLQTKHYGRQYPFDANVDGPRISAPHLRDLRPLRDAGGHGGHLGGERVADDRQRQPSGRNL